MFERNSSSEQRYISIINVRPVLWKNMRTKIINNERNKGIIVAKVNENAYVSLR